MKPFLLVHCMQNDDIPEGSSNDIGPMARKIVPNIQKVVVAARNKGIPIVHVRDVHRWNDPFFKAAGIPPHGIEGGPGVEFIKELAPKKEDFVVTGSRPNSFVGTDLGILLRNLGVDTMIITGVVLENGVYLTIWSALDLGYKVILPKDCVATRTQKKYNYAMELLSFQKSIKMITSEEFIKELS